MSTSTIYRPDVLPWTSLYKDSYLQLLCALKDKAPVRSQTDQIFSFNYARTKYNIYSATLSAKPIISEIQNLFLVPVV